MTLKKAAALAGLGCALCVTPAAAQQERAVRGQVRAVEDSVPLASVLVAIVRTGLATLTDDSGRFVIRGAPGGRLQIAVRRLGIAADTVVLAAERDTLTVYVRARAVTLAPVVVVGERSVALERFETVAQTSTVTLERADITSTPGLLEADVLRVVQLLPGLVVKNDYTIGYNVRGGESDQNLIQLDGVTIFNPSHLAGLFSTFDANAIDRADFLTGGFPAGYSGRLSSVLDITLRSGTPGETRMRGQVSLLSSKLLAEGPIGGATFLVSGRRTYADAVVSAFSSEVLPYYFADLLGKVRYPYGSRGSVAATAYWGRDVLDFQLVKAAPGRDPVNLAFDWGNRLIGLTWRQPTGRTGTLEHRVAYSDFSTTLGLLPNLVRFDNDARVISLQSVYTPHPHAVHDVRLGAGVERYTMNYRISSPTLETTFFVAQYRPVVWSAFIDDRWAAGDGLLLRAGLRGEHVAGAGFTALSPRLTVKRFLGATRAVSVSVGRYYQAIHSIRDQELPITIFEFWIGADEHIPVARSDHAVLGYEQWFGRDVQLSVEGYGKTFRNLVTPNRAQDLRLEGDEFIPVDGYAWGLDLLLRRHFGTVRGWIAYGFVKTVRRALGVEFPPAHDRRHSLNVVMLMPGPLGSDMGVRWGFGSPLPYTGFTGEWEHRRYSATGHAFEATEREPISTRINGERFPTYSRLDVRLHWDFDKWGVRWEPYLQVANIYNRKNVFLYFFDYQDSPATRTGVSQLPILPTFGIEFTF